MPVDPLHFFTAEWDRLVASGAADTALVEWAVHDRSWAGYGSALQVVAALDRWDHGGDRDRANRVLLGLVRAAGEGGAASRVAAVLVAARMLPAAGVVVAHLLSAQSRAGRTGTVADARATVAGCLWAQVRTYPLSRTGNVAGNLKLDVLREALLAHDVHPRSTERATPTDPHDLPATTGEQSTEPGCQASEELIRVLSWAVTEHVLDRSESDLLLARWASGTKPVPARVLSGRLNVNQRTLARRCTAAEQALSAAVRTGAE